MRETLKISHVDLVNNFHFKNFEPTNTTVDFIESPTGFGAIFNLQ
jgi:hypothetical protein